MDTERLPMMPIRDVVIFPHMMTPFVVGRKSSVRALEESMASDQRILLATQRDASIDDPKPDDIYGVGTVVHIVQSLPLPNGHRKVLVEGRQRAHVVSVADEEGFFRATVRTSSFKIEAGPQLEALVSRVTSLVERYARPGQNPNYATGIRAIPVDEPDKLADTVAANLRLTVEEKQELLEVFDPIERLTRIAGILETEAKKRPGTALHQEIDFPAAPSRIYEILLDARQFTAFTHHPAEIQPRPGEAFRLFGGLIEGLNVELAPDSRIVQAWRLASWPAGVYSIVRMELLARGSGTRLVLDHTGFAEDQWEHLSGSWQTNYWEPLRQYLSQ